MLNMSEDFSRLAGDIVVQKWAREDLLRELAESVRERRTVVGRLLDDLRLSREAVAREMREEMNAAREERTSERYMGVERFKEERDQLRQKLAADATSFMQALKASVADSCSAFKAERERRADEVHHLSEALIAQLDTYRSDRGRAVAAWRAGGYAMQGSWLAPSARQEGAKPQGGA